MGNLLTAILNNLYTNHPYHWPTIGSMEDLNAAKLDEFLDFYKKILRSEQCYFGGSWRFKTRTNQKWIAEYYGSIPKGEVFPKNFTKDAPITQEKEVTVTDANIQLPAYVFAYRTPSNKEKDAYALQMLSTYLSNGKSSVLYKN